MEAAEREASGQGAVRVSIVEEMENTNCEGQYAMNNNRGKHYET